MKTSRPITISDIVAATGLSRATIDRVINNRSGVHPRTEAHVRRVLSQLETERSPTAETRLESAKDLKFGLVVQAGQAFTRSLLTELEKFPDPAFAGFQANPMMKRSISSERSAAIETASPSLRRTPSQSGLPFRVCEPPENRLWPWSPTSTRIPVLPTSASTIVRQVRLPV